MKRKIIGNVEPKCEYCKNGTPSSDGKKVLCAKVGLLEPDFSCKKFSYDPLKRVPKKSNPPLLQFSPEDFEL